ncbi:putative polysaccharide biosynthesis protein [Paenibacillus senegalensis]|uniref:putative polysaccharide biosynthesis protein n=1 Tax=Paenibacillus senegalensis TaxID=1465766 RepID=UPI0002898636|nr:polysaccharide biosynthesis protein [Paenibacillus senegalensis]
MSKDSLIKGTLILAVAALVARVLGVVQKVPLIHLIGDSGMATFGIAFNIYTILMTVATAGIPSALSKMVSERMELGRYAEAERVYKAAVMFAIAAGAFMTILLILFAPLYASKVGDESAVLAIRALAPALLLFPLIAIMRGYFQGRQRMMPNGISQIIEQVLRLITAIGLAYLLLQLDWGHDWAVAGASFGGVMGSVGAFAILYMFYKLLRAKDEEHGRTPTPSGWEKARQLSYGVIYRDIFRLSVPIVLFSIAVPLIYFIDSSTVIPLLQDTIGADQAKDELGILTGRAQSLAGIPIILAIALSQSIVPIVSAAYARKDLTQVNRQASKALQISLLTGLPVILAIAAAGRSVNGLLFPDEKGTGVIVFLTLTALFQILMQTSGAILMGIGLMRPLIVNVVAGIVIKVAFSFILAPWLGIYGIVTATALCFITMMLLNLRVLRQRVRFRVLTLPRWIRLLFIAAVSFTAGFAVERGLHALIHDWPFKLGYFLTAGITGGLVTALFIALLIGLRVIKPEELDRLPGPLRKLLRKGAALLGR